MKRMQKMLSIVLSAILVVSLCCAAPMTASAQEDTISQALAAAVEGEDSFSPAEMVKSMYKIITLMLTIDGLDIDQADMDAINQALATAKPIVDNPDATEQELQTAAMALSEAMTVLMPYLESVGDEISPQIILVVCETVRMAVNSGMADLTPEQKAEIETALAAAEAVANDPDSSAEDLQNAMEELMEAIEAIGPDYPFDPELARQEILFEAEVLEGELDSLSFLLSEEDAAAILKITEELNAIAGQKEITEADYNQAQTLFLKAYDLIDKCYTRENLKRVIDYAQETIASGEYTEMSVEMLQDAINDAQLVYDNDTATDEDIIEAIQLVLLFIEDLEPAGTEDPTDDPTDGPTDDPTDDPTTAPTSAPTNAPTAVPTSAPTSSDNGKVNTGDNSGTTVLALTITMLAAAAFVIISRKKKETV